MESFPDGPVNHLPDKIIPASDLLEEVQCHIVSVLGNDGHPARKDTYYQGLAYSIRDRLITRWLNTQSDFYRNRRKRVYYLSMEFLPGKFLINNAIKLGILEEAEKAMKAVGLDIDEVAEEEWDPGIGNGGLGRLASCYMDSMAGLGVPSYGYGIRYDYGLFFQEIVDGYQVEKADNWVRYGNPWEIRRPNDLYKVNFYGRSESYTDKDGNLRYRWCETEDVMAMACDFLIPGFGSRVVNNIRLWTALSTREFNLQEFNQGDYVGAMQAKVTTENISKVLYPRDETVTGKELRLKQQYFFVAATFKDIVRRFKKHNDDFTQFPNAVAVQLNDTHPCVAIPELMRILMDEEYLGWEASWEICTKTFSYTNHTVLPEALEIWPADLFGRILPRHLEIVYEIDRRFLSEVAKRHPGDDALRKRMAVVQGSASPNIHMANLAIIGSHKVNGVSALHSRILKEQLFKDYDRFFPKKFMNVTNGITPVRWLMQANPRLSELITSLIGPSWKKDLNHLRRLTSLARDEEVLERWRSVKQENKQRLVKYIKRKTGIVVDPRTLFDVQAKRIHEYKRQLLNILHVIVQYNRIRQDAAFDAPARTIIFSGKAAPGYFMAKLMIKLITSVGRVVNADRRVNEKMKVVFLPNYCVSQAERIVAAAELTQQISTAGMEASGTGNMKFSLNGALIIGTLDGANIEIMEEVGRENIFIFGLTAEQVASVRSEGYRPYDHYVAHAGLKQALDMIRDGYFTPEDRNLFAPIWASLLADRDPYMVLADFPAYEKMQAEVGRVYRSGRDWWGRSLHNTAKMGYFSSDRAVETYAREIWGTPPQDITSLSVKR